MKIFGKYIFPRQIILFGSGLLFLASTTYDVHRSIKNNQTPPSKEQIEALQDYISSNRRSPGPRPELLQLLLWDADR